MKRLKILTSILCSLALSSCGISSTAATDTKKEPVVIFAAASLHQTLPELLSKLAPDIPVTFNFGGSSGLVDQLSSGAYADLLLTANEANMDKAQEKNLVNSPSKFTTNTMVLAMPKDNPGNITGFTDGSLTGKKLVICASEVPCGAATQKLSQLNHITLTPVSQEQSVTSVLGKLISGEADAGIIYQTDAKSAQRELEIIHIPHSNDVVNNYMIGLTTQTTKSEAAQKIRDVITSPAGQKELAAYGFTSPKETS